MSAEEKRWADYYRAENEELKAELEQQKESHKKHLGVCYEGLRTHADKLAAALGKYTCDLLNQRKASPKCGCDRCTVLTEHEKFKGSK